MFAKEVLESRGNSPRLYKNTLAFLAVDKTRLQDLDEAVRKYLAWESILAEKDTLNLDPTSGQTSGDAEGAADSTVTAAFRKPISGCSFRCKISRNRRSSGKRSG